MRGLKGKIAIVTGSARGLGRAAALRLSEEGCIVWMLDMNAAVQDEARQIAEVTGNAVYAAQTDIRFEQEVASTFRQIEQQVGHVDILVNNAAAFVFKGVDATQEDWNRILDVNVKGTSFVTRQCIPLMKKAGGGSIVNLSSISGFIGQPEFATYNATKFALRGLTKCWAIDLAADRIRVNTVCPGYIRTDAFEDSCRQLGRDVEEENRRVSAFHILQRQGKPSEVASAVAFLASDDASFITGSDLLVDGGYCAL